MDEEINIIKNRICQFLEINNWEYDSEAEMYIKDENICIAVDRDYIVFVNDSGDYLHHKINIYSYYWLIGYLIDNHLLAVDYKSMNKTGN